MKKIILTIILLFCCISCGPSKYVITNDIETYGHVQMYYAMDKIVTMSQVDSMITVDKLADLDKWLITVNGDKTKQLKQYYYIKSNDVNNELVYILTQTQVDTVFRCVKRITKEIGE